MLIYRLVLTNGVVITTGDAWPGPNGKPCTIKDGDKQVPIPGHVWQISFVPDTVETYEDEGIAETTPAHYKVLMRADGGGGLKNSTGDEETQCYTVWASQVVMTGEVWGWNEALEEFAELLGVSPGNGKQAQDKPKPVEAAP